MPVEAHARIGSLLKGVLIDMRASAGVYKRVDAIRSELDDWVQCEHDRQAMSDAAFFDLYYGENSSVGEPKSWRTARREPAPRTVHIDAALSGLYAAEKPHGEDRACRHVTREVGVTMVAEQTSLSDLRLARIAYCSFFQRAICPGQGARYRSTPGRGDASIRRRPGATTALEKARVGSRDATARGLFGPLSIWYELTRRHDTRKTVP
uniref:DUF5623 domain-containing protein n=1 Tax=Mesorhizobium sp. WSM4875 TaxID=3038539 RepID=UPI002415A363|nr:DUF5623 domain-containing protein [Mesorhizobium sp. WSM4875]WIE94725.1 DUF5623 domain-containing protein [Mesorhizobium sp. WSM4875]